MCFLSFKKKYANDKMQKHTYQLSHVEKHFVIERFEKFPFKMNWKEKFWLCDCHLLLDCYQFVY